MNIRQIIRNILRESEELQTEFGDKYKAKRAIIAFSKGLIPHEDITVLKGHLSPDYYGEEGFHSQDGEVELFFKFEGEVYSWVFNVSGSFYVRLGSSGDYFNPPEHDSFEDEEITLDDEDVLVGDSEGNEYEFLVSELGSEFTKGVENKILNFYDPSEGLISK